MKHILIVLASVAGLSAAAGPAAAQVYSVADILPPQEITAIVRDAGMQPISRPQWRPGRYIVMATDRYGRELRVVVDARMGEIIRAVPVDYADIGPRGGYEPYPRPYAPRDQYAPRTQYGPGSYAPPQDSDEYEDRDDGDMPPPSASPRVIPGPRSAAPSPSRSAAIAPKPEVKKPAAAPLPRSRPADSMASANPSAPAPAAAPATAPSASEKKDVRVIDMSKPKTAETEKAAAAASAPAAADAKAPDTKAAGPEVKALDDSSTKPRF